MQTRLPTPIELTDKEMQALQQYADSCGITADEAATQLASESLALNFERRSKKPGTVVPFRRFSK